MSRINYENNIHKYWINAVENSGRKDADQIIRTIKGRFDNQYVTEVELVKLSKIYGNSPAVLIEVLLHPIDDE